MKTMLKAISYFLCACALSTSLYPMRSVSLTKKDKKVEEETETESKKLSKSTTISIQDFKESIFPSKETTETSQESEPKKTTDSNGPRFSPSGFLIQEHPEKLIKSFEEGRQLLEAQKKKKEQEAQERQARKAKELADQQPQLSPLGFFIQEHPEKLIKSLAEGRQWLEAQRKQKEKETENTSKSEQVSANTVEAQSKVNQETNTSQESKTPLPLIAWAAKEFDKAKEAKPQEHNAEQKKEQEAVKEEQKETASSMQQQESEKEKKKEDKTDSSPDRRNDARKDTTSPDFLRDIVNNNEHLHSTQPWTNKHPKITNTESFVVFALLGAIIQFIREQAQQLGIYPFTKPELKQNTNKRSTPRFLTREEALTKIERKKDKILEKAQRLCKAGTLNNPENQWLKKEAYDYLQEELDSIRLSPHKYNLLAKVLEVKYGIKVAPLHVSPEQQIKLTKCFYNKPPDTINVLQFIPAGQKPPRYSEPMAIGSPHSNFSMNILSNTEATNPDVDYLDKQLIQEPTTNGKKRYLDPKEPCNKRKINELLDEIPSGIYPEWTAIEVCRKQREQLREIKTTKEFIANYSEVKDFFTAEEAVKKALSTATADEAAQLISKLNDRHAISYCKELGEKVKNRTGDLVALEDRMLKSAEAYMDYKLHDKESRPNNLKYVPSESLKYAINNMRGIHNDQQEAKVIGDFLKEYCSESNHTLGENLSLSTYARRVCANDKLAFRVFGNTAKLEEKLISRLCHRLDTLTKKKNTGAWSDNIEGQIELISLMETLKNITHARPDLEKLINQGQSNAIQGLEGDVALYRQKKLERCQITEEELHRISKRYRLPSGALLTPLPTKAQRDFQEGVVKSLKELSLVKNSESYNDITHDIMGWALRLNEQHKTKEAQELKESLSLMAKLSQGIWDKAAENSMQKMAYSLATLGIKGNADKAVEAFIRMGRGLQPGAASAAGSLLGMFTVPAHIASNTKQLSARPQELGYYFGGIIKAVKNNNFREIGRSLTRLGIVGTDRLFLTKSISSLLRIAGSGTATGRVVGIFLDALMGLSVTGNMWDRCFKEWEKEMPGLCNPPQKEEKKPQGTCQTISPKPKLAPCSNANKAEEKEKAKCDTGKGQPKKQETRTCNAEVQTAPSLKDPAAKGSKSKQPNKQQTANKPQASKAPAKEPAKQSTKQPEKTAEQQKPQQQSPGSVIAAVPLKETQLPAPGVAQSLTQNEVRPSTKAESKAARAAEKAAKKEKARQDNIEEHRNKINELNFDIINKEDFKEAFERFKHLQGFLETKKCPFKNIFKCGKISDGSEHISNVRGHWFEIKSAIELANDGHEIIGLGVIIKGEGTSKELDIVTATHWVECKNRNWNQIPNLNEEIADLKSDIGRALKLAEKNGKGYIFKSAYPIPEELKNWLKNKNVTIIER